MGSGRDDLKVVVLENPYRQIHDKKVQNFFCDIIQMKKVGYQSRLEPSVLVADQYDFVSTHFIVCSLKNGTYVPLIGYKSLSLEASNCYKLDFIMNPSIKKLKNHKYFDILQEEIKLHHPRNVVGNTSYTLNPILRKNKELHRKAKELLTVVHTARALEDSEIHQFTAGNIAFGVYEYFQTLGYRSIDESLPPYKHFITGIEVKLMKLEKIPKETIQLYELNKECWNNRIKMTPTLQESITAA